MRSRFLNIALSVILVVSLINIIGKVFDISAKTSENKEIESKIRDQKLSNNEYDSILDEDNLEDFYRIIAEDELNLANGDEIIYKDYTGY